MEKADKEYLYKIINYYLNKQINPREFCDEFYYCYSKELDYDTLSDKEQIFFGKLSTITSRFSEFVEDHIKYPGTYFDKKDLDSTIQEVSEQLKKAFN